MYLPAIKNGLTFHLNFRASTDTLEAGAAPSIANIWLHIVGNSLPYKHANKMVKQYQTNTLDFCFTNIVVNQITSSVAASSTYSLTLSGLSGMLAGGFIVFRTGSSGAALRTFSSLASGQFDIVDSSDRTLLGGYKPAAYNLIWDWQRLFGNDIGSNQPIYVVAHASSLQSFVQQGVMTGFNFYDGNNRLKFTTDSSWTSGTYNISYLAKQYAIIRLINGRIEVPYLS